MASYTPNINLKKPTTSEYYNVLDENSNKDKIDTAIGNLNSQLTSQYGNIITDVQYEVCANIVTVYFNGAIVADASAWTKIADLPSGLNTRYSAHFKAMTGQEIQIAGSVINYRGSAGYIFGACTYVRG